MSNLTHTQTTEALMPPAQVKTWTQQEGIDLCRKIEKICPTFGCHIALTGGLLYKDGPRKDCDLLFYRIRDVEEIDIDGLWEALEPLGFTVKSGFGWCYKASYMGRSVDCFFPEEKGGNYYGDEEEEESIL